MDMVCSRRTLIAVLSGALSADLACAAAPAGDTALRELEERVGGRLGVSVVDTGSGRELNYRCNERFGMCSTFKLPLVILILREVEAGRLSLDHPVPFAQPDMLDFAPVTSKHLVAGSMTVGELAEAAQTASDNVAANLLLRLIGGPEGFTSQLRMLGDRETRLDRTEPAMNLVPPGEIKDTSTPRSMAQLIARATVGDSLLGPQSRAQLLVWMFTTETGLKRLRAGFPSTWPAGDKTGTAYDPSMPNKVNDVGVVWPPGKSSIAYAAYYEAPGHFDATRDEDQAVLADVGRIVAGWAARG